ncbi:hepatic and glial cell adhesion molecule-like [Triplophysa dalaica]|uniref:hepatic and glial cell adhesion molecule-like n=1 Tax=Triplophysa dalaica TaxID=1582913 RepID=UPI0024DFE395|nr:hepatic and glial cell adhesion molecule-like [Triplophysa dalaica]
MDICSVFLSMMFLTACGVFGDEVKSLSVTEGESVTLHTDIVKQTDDKIVWYYGPENTFVARINGMNISTIYSDDERFKDRMKLNDQTGDLTITHITSQHSGLYKLKISRNKKASYKNFNLTVNARLPVPALIRDSSQISSSSSSLKCSVLCSVMNVSHDVSVSWYKGKSLLSSISVSEHSIIRSISLHLECLDDSDVYSCVINNSISTQTQHLNTDVCHKCSDSPNMRRNMWIIILTVIFALLICVIIIIKHKRRVQGFKAAATRDFSRSSEDSTRITREKHC